MPRVLVIRFGALGDLCLLAWSLAAREQPGDDRPQTTLVTKPEFADLMAAVPGIDEVIPLPGPRLRDLNRLAGQLRAARFDRIVDAHDNLRSHLLCRLMRRRPDARVAKDTAARLALLFLRRAAPTLDRTMRDRFDELFPAAPPPPPPLAALASGPRRDGLLGIAPGAAWDAKRWPSESFAEVLRGWIDTTGGRVRIFLGPREERWFADSDLSALARRDDAVCVWMSRGLAEVASGLAECAVLLTNDSGLMHVAEGVGTPVLALFGPTVREFGYFPQLVDSVVAERSLFCRPCSRNGRRPCFRGDQACLASIPPRDILDRLLAMPPWRASGGEVETGA